MAYYSEDLVDEVISRADIVEVINTYVPLKKRGANFLGLCPFHKEKTPSFTVSQDKQIYKCFGCGAGGNVISFVSKIENLDFESKIKLFHTKVKKHRKHFYWNCYFVGNTEDNTIKVLFY